MSRDRMRLAVVVCASILCLSTAAGAFWYQDWQYSRPTPRPEGLVQPAFGDVLQLPPELRTVGHQRPLVIHVVNPDCPCSRFNRDHIRSLVRRFGEQVDFVALVQGSDDPRALEQAFEGWHLGITFVADPGGKMAARFGVYSTPQAVVLDLGHRLYFRGNYNQTRYCADVRSEYARMAIESLLAGRPLPAMPADATVAYGCPLPQVRDNDGRRRGI